LYVVFATVIKKAPILELSFEKRNKL